MSLNTLDITPTPRILRTLGEIPFQTWQCIAELIDNSIDAFLSNTMFEEQIQKITVTWSSDSVGAMDRTLEVSDNASGMSIDQLQNAVRAGYTTILSATWAFLVWVLISRPRGWGRKLRFFPLKVVTLTGLALKLISKN